MPDGASIVSSRATVTIEGTTRPAIADNALDAVIRQPEDGLASAELRLVNWGSPPSGGEPDFLFGDLALGQKLAISFGLETETRLFDGEITGLEERYGGGAPQLVVLAEDMLHRLARKRLSRVFEQQSPNDILRSIAADAGLSPDVRVSDEPGTWHQLNESDLALLRRLAGIFGARLRSAAGKLVCRLPDPPGTPVRLDTGDTLKSVRLLADLAMLPRQARTAGWDLAADNAVQGSASSAIAAPSGTPGASLLQRIGWTDDALFADPAPLTQGAANAYAAASYDKTARRFVAGDIVCVGNPAIVAGGAVSLAGVSPRMRGTYDVVASLHHFSLGHGYETYARIERGWWN
jgi:phage protein D